MAIASILAQVVLNTEVMRYTLCTGEPIFTGFLRSRPGPRFWLITYLLIDCLTWWPSLGGLAAQILLAVFYGDQQPPVHVVRITWTCVLLTCVALLCVGGKIYNTLEWVLSGKVFFVLAFLIVMDLFFIEPHVWVKITAGFFKCPGATINSGIRRFSS